MHQEPQATNLSDNTLRHRDAILRSGQPAHPRHRLQANANSYPARQRSQATSSPALTATTQRAERILEAVQAQLADLSRQDTRQAVCRHVDSKGDQRFGKTCGHQEEYLASHAQAFLRDGTVGSGSRLADDQSSARPCVLRNDDDLSTLSPRTSAQCAKPAGLAASETTAHLSSASVGPAAGPAARSERSITQRPITRRSTTELTASKLTIAQILRSQCAAYVKQYADRGACQQVQSVLAKLSLCRTQALGGKSYQCDDCGEVTHVHHSCGDRHCPQCSGCKRFDFAKRAEQLILDGVTYYQVVFTLPGVISELALTNREAIADLLFEAASASLRKTIRSQQEYDPRQ